MREIVVISGKGGTGKTTVCAAFAHLAENAVICDLDVDVPDLHIVLDRAWSGRKFSFPAIRRKSCRISASNAAVARTFAASGRFAMKRTFCHRPPGLRGLRRVSRTLSGSGH